MKFNKIVCLDETKLSEEALAQLKNYAEEKIDVYSEPPQSETEIIQRIGNAEAVLLSWRTPLSENVIAACENLKYIGLACSFYDAKSSNVAANYAKKKGIRVTGIFDYGDPGVSEFIISELIQLLHGLKGTQWKKEAIELTDLNIGIVGLGTTGQLLAKCLLPFGANIYYYSRNRKKTWESIGVQYLAFEKLLEKCEIVSFHLPKNTKLMGIDEFETFGTGKILINTSLGLPFLGKDFSTWIKKPGNFGIFDGDGGKALSKTTKKLPRVIISNKSAGWSTKTRKRLSQKTIDNLKEFLNA